MVMWDESRYQRQQKIQDDGNKDAGNDAFHDLLMVGEVTLSLLLLCFTRCCRVARASDRCGQEPSHAAGC